MMITLEFPNQTTEVLPLSRAEVLATQYDAVPVVRAAFTTEWNADAYPAPSGTRVRMHFRATSLTGIAVARAVALAAIDSIDAAVLLITPYGAWVPAGIESIVDTPAPLGYDVSVTVIVREPRYPTPADAFRLVGGGVWQFR